jgi:hypothetical protein
MNGEWKMIGQGFAVAVAGAASAMLLIVGGSALYVGKFTIAVASLATAGCLAIGFRTAVRWYLNALEQREKDFIIAVEADSRQKRTANIDPA